MVTMGVGVRKVGGQSFHTTAANPQEHAARADQQRRGQPIECKRRHLGRPPLHSISVCRAARTTSSQTTHVRCPRY
jgi:hypothetical protein